MTITLYINKKELSTVLFKLSKITNPEEDLDELKERYTPIKGISIHRDNVMLLNQVAIQISYEEFEAIEYFVGDSLYLYQ